MSLSTRQLAAFIQKVAKLQPQTPQVVSDLKGCSTCIPTLSGFGTLDMVPWKWVVPSALAGAGVLLLVQKRRHKMMGLMRKKRAKKNRHRRRSRRSRR